MPGFLLPTWARQAEQHDFSTLATIDRVAFGSHDSLIALAAAAAVTERIELLTNILLLPTRQPVLLAKEAATISSISDGRFTLGVGVGGREDDFVSTETSFAGRGKRMDEMAGADDHRLARGAGRRQPRARRAGTAVRNGAVADRWYR